jgi:hypothetical protein
MSASITPKGPRIIASSVAIPVSDSLEISGLGNETAVVWQDGSDAVMQLLIDNGNFINASIELIPAPAGSSETQSGLHVVALANGNFAMTWTDTFTIANNSSYENLAQIYDPQGNKVGSIISVFPLRQGTGDGAGAMYRTPDGGFGYADTSNGTVEWQLFHADGSKNGGLVTGVTGVGTLLAATVLTNGNTAVLSTNPTPEIAPPDSFTVHDQTGHPIEELPVRSDGNAFVGDLAALPDGRFVVVYSLLEQVGNLVGVTLRAKVFNGDGTVFLDEISINNGALDPGGVEEAHVAVMPDGRMIFTWFDTSGDANNNLTEVRVIEPNGNPVTDVFAIPGSVETGDDGANSIAALNNTSFAVSWSNFTNIGNQVFTMPPPPDVADNFIGYGTSDVLLQSRGSVIDWIVSNGTFASFNPIGNAGSYGIVGSGDFNGDGTTDLLLKNGSGAVIDWIIQNGSYQGYNAVGSPAGYGIVGTGDYNGDGTSDVLLENGSGNLIDWIMQNGAYAGYNNIGGTGGYGVAGKGDFDGDGTSDILLQNSSGNLIDWTLKNGAFAGWNGLGNPAAAGYGVVGTGDFNGDGATDLLLVNGGGNLIDWTIQNGVYAGWNEVGSAAGYSVVGTGDFNGDGTTDILLENSSDNLIDWIMKNGAYSGWNEIGSAGGYAVVNK